MRMYRELCFLCVACVVFCASCTSPTKTTRVPSCEDVLDRMDTLLAQHRKPPDHLTRTNSIKKSGDFDVSQFFKILPNVSMEKGYCLDYVHFYSPGGCAIACRPELYARKTSQKPYATVTDFWNQSGDAIENSFGHPDFPPWLEHVKCDGSPEGFLQLFMLAKRGADFYDYGETEHPMRTSATVTLKQDSATVNVDGTEWTVRKQFPHMVLSSGTTQFSPGTDSRHYSATADALARGALQQDFRKGQFEGRSTKPYLLADYKRLYIRFARSKGDHIEVRYFLKEAKGHKGQPRWLTVYFNEETETIKVDSAYRKGEPYPFKN